MIFLKRVKAEFLKWRAERKKLNEKTPENLLKLASKCAFKYGKCITLKELNLSGSKLNEAMNKYSKNNILDNIYYIYIFKSF